MPPPTKAASDDEDDDAWINAGSSIKKRACFKALICKLSGVPVSQYEEWLDSMSPEYFALYCEAILDKEMTQVLLR